MLRAVFFDFNGVLVDDEPLHLELIRRVLDEEGIPLSEKAYHEHCLGLDDRSCFAAILRHAGRDDDLGMVMRLTTRKATYYQAAIRQQGYPFFSGAAALVRACREAGWMLGVVSGALYEEVDGALAQEGLRDHFKVVITAEDVQAGKPDPEGYLLGLERFNAQPPLPDRLIHPHEVLAIEDTPPGLRAAAAAGLSTLALAHTYPTTTLEGLGVAVEASISILTVERLQALYQ